MAAAGRVGVRELVDQHELGPALQDRVEIHLRQHAALIGEPLLGNDLEALGEPVGFDAAMRLDDADDDVDALEPALAAPGSASRRSCRRRAPRRGKSSAGRDLPARLLQQRIGRRSIRDRAGRHSCGRIHARTESTRPERLQPSAFAPIASSARLSFSTLTCGSPMTPRKRSSICAFDELAHGVFGKAARLGHARHLEIGRGRRDVGIEAAGRGGDEIDRDRRVGIFGVQLRRIARHALDQRLGRRAEIRAAGIVGVDSRLPGGRRTAVEIFGAR